MTVVLITVATHDYGYLQVLKESCNRHGFELIVLGWGATYTGHLMKTELTIPFLEKCDPMQIVMFVDGFDSLIMRNVDDVESIFVKMNVPFIFSADMKLTHDMYLDEYIGKITGVVNRVVCNSSPDAGMLNSGLFIGYAASLLRVLRESVDMTQKLPDIKSNQRMLQEVCKTNPFAIDTNRHLFYNRNFTFLRKEKFRNGEFWVKTNDAYTQPCVISAPAGGSLDDILKELNYSTKMYEAKHSILYLLKTTTFNYKRLWFVCILAIIVVCIFKKH